MIKKKRNTILVLGGTGFIGYHLLKKTLKLGWNSFSASRKKPIKNRYLQKVKYMKLDFKNLENLKVRDYDFIVNLSNIHYSKAFILINFLKKIKIQKYLEVGSSAEYGNINKVLDENTKCKPISLYGKNKLKITNNALKIFKKHSFPVIVVRLFQVYGSFDNKNKIIPFVINNCLKNKKFNLTEGFQTRDFCHINDVINAIIKLLTSKNKRVIGEIYNIGFGSSITIKELVEKIKRKIGKGLPVFGQKKISNQEIIHSKSSIKKIKQYIKWSPKINLDDGISGLIKHER